MATLVGITDAVERLAERVQTCGDDELIEAVECLADEIALHEQRLARADGVDDTIPLAEAVAHWGLDA